MRIDGVWRVCDDGIVRPMLRAEVRAANGDWIPLHLLVDVGADRSVFTAGVLEALGIPGMSAKEQIEGLGGRAESVVITTQIRMPRATGATAVFTGQFTAVTRAEALDVSVLGRDITNLFALIVDRPQDVVCLLGGNHGYTIVTK